MKKILSILTFLTLTISFAGCGDSKNSDKEESTSEATSIIEETTEDDTTEELTTTIEVTTAEPTTIESDTQTYEVVLNDIYENDFYTIAVSSEWTYRQDGTYKWVNISNDIALKLWGATTSLNYDNNKDFAEFWVKDSNELDPSYNAEVVVFGENYYAKVYDKNNDSIQFTFQDGDYVEFFEFYVTDEEAAYPIISAILESAVLKYPKVDGLEKYPANSPTQASANGSSPKSTNETSTLSIGQEWLVDNQWSLTITSVTETADRNQFSDKAANAVYIIDYTYTNLGYEADIQDLYMNLEMASIVDSAGYMGSSYPLHTEYNPQPTPIGATCKAQAIICVENPGGFQLYFDRYDNSGTKHSIIFDLSV